MFETECINHQRFYLRIAIRKRWSHPSLCPLDDRFEVDEELELLARLVIAQLADQNAREMILFNGGQSASACGVHSRTEVQWHAALQGHH